MANKMLLECVDRSIREVMENDQPFGGITVVFSGDWRQCLPIVPRGGKAEIMAATMKSSNLWRVAIVHKLTENMRLRTGGEDYADFANWLMRVGNGTEVTYPEVGEGMIRIPDANRSQVATLQEFCDEIFPDIKGIGKSVFYFITTREH